MKTNYKQIINRQIEELNKLCNENEHYKANFNSVYGGWRLERYINESSAEQLSVLRNTDRLPSKSFYYYMKGILTTIYNFYKITRPF